MQIKSLNYKENRFIKYYINQEQNNTLIEALHTETEFYLKEIINKITELKISSTIKSKLPRTEIDLNREISSKNKEAIKKYREIIQKILTTKKIENKLKVQPFLHISIHGMKDRKEKDIEIGTRNKILSNPEIYTWFIETTKKHFNKFKVVIDKEFKGSKILEQHRFGDNTGHKGFGINYNIFQIEFSKTLRETHKKEIIKYLEKITKEFQIKFIKN